MNMNDLNKDNGRLKLAIQKSGRITDGSIELLRGSGFSFSYRDGVLYSPLTDFPMDILFIRDDDIPRYVQEGICDLGIVGSNVIEEKEPDIEILTPLNFGRCRISLCVPNDSNIKSVDDLNSRKIATTYPLILSKFLKSNDLSCEISEISGSTELTPSIGVADAICEIISSGSTIKFHGLKELKRIFNSEATLIGNKSSLQEEASKELILQLLVRVKSRVLSRDKKYIAMNAPFDKVEELKKILPGIKSPTVIPLLEEGMVAMHSVVNEQDFWEVLEELKFAGASGIVVSSIDNIIP